MTQVHASFRQVDQSALNVSIADNTGPLNAPSITGLIQHLRMEGQYAILHRSSEQGRDQADRLVRLAAFYDIYMDSRLKEEAIVDTPAPIVEARREAVVQVGTAVAYGAGVALYNWIVDNKSAGGAIGVLAKAILQAEGRR